MAARVHAPGNAALEFDFRLFVHRERVHVRAQRNARFATCADRRNDSSSSNWKSIGDVELIEHLSHYFARSHFLVHDLGIHVQLAAD